MGAPPFGSRPQSGSQMSVFSTLQLQTWVVALQDALSISGVCEAKAEGDPHLLLSPCLIFFRLSVSKISGIRKLGSSLFSLYCGSKKAKSQSLPKAIRGEVVGSFRVTALNLVSWLRAGSPCAIPEK